MTALARFVVVHRWAVVALWLFAIVSAQTAAAVVESDYRNDLSLEGTDSQAAIDLLDERFPAAAGDADTIVWQVDRGSAVEGEAAQTMQALLADVSEVGSVTSIRGPLAPQAEGMPSSAAEAASPQVSGDGSIAYATLQYDRVATELPREELEVIADLVAEADEVGGEELAVAVAGQGVAMLSSPEVGVLEIVGLAFAAVVLLLAFGSFVAMTLPIVSAVAALGVALGALGVLSQVVTISDVAPVLGVLLGLGVGIDYALFIVNRFRGELLLVSLSTTLWWRRPPRRGEPWSSRVSPSSSPLPGSSCRASRCSTGWRSAPASRSCPPCWQPSPCCRLS